ncbi:MAG: hypothetical protein ACLPN5_10290, partial [Roseiarcus sp.]
PARARPRLRDSLGASAEHLIRWRQRLGADEYFGGNTETRVVAGEFHFSRVQSANFTKTGAQRENQTLVDASDLDAYAQRQGHVHTADVVHDHDVRANQAISDLSRQRAALDIHAIGPNRHRTARIRFPCPDEVVNLRPRQSPGSDLFLESKIILGQLGCFRIQLLDALALLGRFRIQLLDALALLGGFLVRLVNPIFQVRHAPFGFHSVAAQVAPLQRDERDRRQDADGGGRAGDPQRFHSDRAPLFGPGRERPSRGRRKENPVLEGHASPSCVRRLRQIFDGARFLRKTGVPFFESAL